MKKINISREIFFEQSEILRQFVAPDRESSTSYLLFLVFPALIYGCSTLEVNNAIVAPPEDTTETILANESKTTINVPAGIASLDVFTFEDDRLQRLDSYQRFEGTINDRMVCDIASRSGTKVMTMLANSSKDRYEWTDINCRAALENLVFSLENERYDLPLMTSEHHVSAGSIFNSEFSHLSGEVRLRSLKCDFSGKPYEGEELTDVRIYLTNVNADISIGTDGDTNPTRIINAGRLNDADIKRFREPEIIFRELEESVGTEKIHPDVRLRAYPNCCPEESIGSPFTRLVIEGRICGNTYYYPIAINRMGGVAEYGLRSNRCYIYDLNISQTGLTDPDGNIDNLSVEINMEVEEWKEKDWYDVRF